MCNFIKKWLQHRCFPVNFKKIYFVKDLWTAASERLWYKFQTVSGKLPAGKFPPMFLNILTRFFLFFFIIVTVITDTT